MIVVRKWDELKGNYVMHCMPDGWKVLCYSTDMDEPCNCAECGRPMTYGEGYTSHTIQTASGFGYAICKDCYGIEIQERLRARMRT